MKRSHLSLLVLSAVLLGGSVPRSSAQDDKPVKEDSGPRSFKDRGDLLAKTLIFSEEFTRVTDLRTKEGLPDYPAAINAHFGKGVSPDKNGAVALYEAFGPAPEGIQLSEKFFKLLGMSAPPADGKYFQHFGVGLPVEKRRSLNDRYAESWKQPWAEKDFPELAQWLRDNEKPVETIVKGAMQPDYYSPLVPSVDAAGNAGGLISALLPGIQQSRSIARYLVSRAMLNIEKGNVDHAWRDLIACHRLGEMIGRGPTLIEYLVGTAITQIATHGQIVYLDRVQPAAAQLAQYRKDLANLRPIRAAAEQMVVTERMMYLDSVVQIACGRIAFNDLDVSPASGLEKFATQLAILSVDWNIVMREGNRMYDRFDAAMKLESYQERRAAMLILEQELQKVKANVSAKGFLLAAATEGSTGKAFGKMMGGVLTALLLPAISSVDKAHNRSVQNRENLLLAFALASWKDRHDTYPEKLDELVPDFISKPPVDAFTGMPLTYRREGDGFVLYSVGVNEEDDNGQSYDDDPRGDDLVVRLPLPEVNNDE